MATFRPWLAALVMCQVLVACTPPKPTMTPDMQLTQADWVKREACLPTLTQSYVAKRWAAGADLTNITEIDSIVDYITETCSIPLVGKLILHHYSDEYIWSDRLTTAAYVRTLVMDVAAHAPRR